MGSKTRSAGRVLRRPSHPDRSLSRSGRYRRVDESLILITTARLAVQRCILSHWAQGGSPSWTSSSRAARPRCPSGSASTWRSKLAKIAEARRQGDQRRRRGVQGAQPPPGRPRDRVEITLHSRGPVVRAEASAAATRYAALDLAVDEAGGAAAQGARPAQGAPRQADAGSRCARSPRPCRDRAPATPSGELTGRRRSSASRRPRIGRWRCEATARWWSARRRTPPRRWTLDQALYEMELVGHDFYPVRRRRRRGAQRRLPAARPTTTA